MSIDFDVRPPWVRDIHYIVLTNAVTDDWELNTNYSIHKELEDARNAYDKILTARIMYRKCYNQEHSSGVTMAAVIESTDYDTNPYVNSLARSHEP